MPGHCTRGSCSPLTPVLLPQALRLVSIATYPTHDCHAGVNEAQLQAAMAAEEAPGQAPAQQEPAQPSDQKQTPLNSTHPVLTTEAAAALSVEAGHNTTEAMQHDCIASQPTVASQSAAAAPAPPLGMAAPNPPADASQSQPDAVSDPSAKTATAAGSATTSAVADPATAGPADAVAATPSQGAEKSEKPGDAVKPGDAAGSADTTEPAAEKPADVLEQEEEDRHSCNYLVSLFRQPWLQPYPAATKSIWW